MAEKQIGYDDTPFIPGMKYRVHDGERPQPPVVEPAPECCGAPSDAVVLFDGRGLDNWVSFRDGGPAPWKVIDGCFEVVPRSGDICTREKIGDCQLHLEFVTPEIITGDGQKRGNSGIFLMGRYEIQVLDCYRNLTYADGTTGAVYGQWPPLVNACRRPGAWQTCDIAWEGPRFDGDRLLRPARVTVLLNGVLVQHARRLLGPTRHKELTAYEPHEAALPLRLQDHGDLVRYRNIWYRPLLAGA